MTYSLPKSTNSEQRMFGPLLSLPGVHWESQPARHLLVTALPDAFTSCSPCRAESSGKKDFPAPKPTVFKRGQILTPFEKAAQKMCARSARFCAPTTKPLSAQLLPSATFHFQALQASHSITENMLTWSECINMHLDHLLNPQGIHCQKICKEWGVSVKQQVWFPLHHFF